MIKPAKKPAAKPSDWASVEDELDWDDVGGRLLANIARGMYSPQGVLREYVQNAVDAYKDLGTPSDEHKITISATATSLSIQDFGVGMDDKGIRAAKKIAVSSKSAFDDRVGFRGIGIWAGLPACKKLIVDSTKAGTPYRYRLVFDFEDIMNHLDDNINIKALVDPRYMIDRQPTDKNDHYTRVTLEGITLNYKQLLEVEQLKRIASQVLPSAIDPAFQHHAKLKELLEKWPGYHECHIFVQTPEGTEEAFRKFPPNEVEEPVEKILTSTEGAELARAWFCRTKKTSLRAVEPPAQRGFQLRIKNFAVGGANIFSDEQGYSYNIHDHQVLNSASRLAWFCGEVHVTNNDIKPNTPRDDLEREQPARMFIEKLRGFYKDRVIEAGAYSEFNPFRNALEEAEEAIKAAKEKKEKEDSKGKEKAKDKDKAAIDPAKLQMMLAKLGEAVNKSKGDSEDQSKKVFKELLRQPWFKDRCAKAVSGIKKLIPPPADDGKPKEGAKTGVTNGSKKKEKEEGAKTASDPQSGSALAQHAEELISEIFAILEKSLGEDFEELSDIQESIQKAIDTWVATYAS
ncbi:MAG: ATP-binding protein [Planctomycetes bacterium]|nr:ATP-binding protein [Planctomycetota bacterium]